MESLELRPEKLTRGPKELTIALEADQSFDEMVESLREALTLREFPGFSGCEPCRSGIERLLLTSRILWR
jgi:hypothetical protein